MKILFLTAFPPCQNTAGQDYSRRLIDDLVKRGHEVSLLYAKYYNHEVELSDKVKVIGAIKPTLLNCLKLVLWYPLYTKRFSYKVLRYIQKESSKYDILYFDYSQIHIYSYFIDHPCKVLMCHDVIYQKIQRHSLFLIPFVNNSENKLLHSATRILTFSSKDSDLLKSRYGVNSSNVNFYIKDSMFDSNATVLKNNFCFYGAWSRPENYKSLLWFVTKILPYINNTVSFSIIGSGMSKKNEEVLSKYKQIRLIGFVDDPIHELSKYQALIAPLKQGAGVKVKVIDSLCSGTPVIGTDIAFEGIEDNYENKLFYSANKQRDFIDIINNWISINHSFKKDASKEFICRYDQNHFADFLNP